MIEIDGDSHYNDGAERYDAARTAALERLGIRVVRFSNEDVVQRFEAVRAEILAALEARRRGSMPVPRA